MASLGTEPALESQYLLPEDHLQAIPYLSLFSGAMGLDLGLERAGFRSVLCNDVDPKCVEAIRLNRPNVPVFARSITELDLPKAEQMAGRALKGIPLMAGGPPCQAFSVYGNRQGINDARGALLLEFVRLVEEVRPQTFVLENVRGLHSMSIVPISGLAANPLLPKEAAEHGSLLRSILARFEAAGYRVDCFLVNAVNYGAPQQRERLICVGNRYNLEANWPSPWYSNRPDDGLPPFKTLRDAIGPSFVDPDPTVMNFSPRKLHYLAMVPPGGNWRSLPVETQKESMGKAWHLKGGRSAYWRKLSWDFPSPTVVTMPNHAGTSMCHPDELRALTVGECAAIQEFPPDWRFPGSPADRYRQVGNAVPVRLGLIAGQVVGDLLRRAELPQAERPPIPNTIRHLRPHVRTRKFWRQGTAFAGDYSYIDSGAAAQLALQL